MRLLWQQNPAPWNPENIDPEYAGWRAEQHAWHDVVALSDVSHHMFDTFIEGPDATKLLQAVSANNYENFAVGQAKQFVPVARNGDIITDGILARTGEQEYVLTGIPAAQNWVKYHGEKGGYDVAFSTDPELADYRTWLPLFGIEGKRPLNGSFYSDNIIGLTPQTATLDTAGTILALTLINKEHATPGTQVTVTWGEHPGASAAADADLGFPKLRATVAPAPYDAYAATQYRRH